MTRKPTRWLLAAAAVSLWSSCGFAELEDDELTLERRPYVGDELRIDGLYYTVEENMYGDLYTVYFFYRNGVVRYGGSSNDPEFYRGNGFLDEQAKYAWGLFHVGGDEITFEKWYPPSKGISYSYISSGHILNDTTFVITESRRSNGEEEVHERDEVYHFRPYGPKPDSTSRFIYRPRRTSGRDDV